MSNPIEKYLVNNTINIESEEWQKLCSDYSSDELIPLFIDAILSGKIEIPLKQISLSDAEKDFCKLMNNDSSKCITDEPMYWRGNYRYPEPTKYVKANYIGELASDFFQQYNRWNCESKICPSPISNWSDPNKVRTIVKGMFSLKWDKMNPQKLRKILQMRTYIASQFKPSVAKTIYERYNAKNVLDFSAGWGDRLCGFYAANCTESYIGIDPNTSVYKKYYEQADFYSTLTKKKSVRFINLPAEDVSIDSECVDTIFTSPPYFNVEHYSEDEGQSWKRYDSLEKWKTGFLYPTLDMCWKALKPKGFLIINIADSNLKGKPLEMCDDMNDYIKSLGGIYVETLGMRMSCRPNSGMPKRNDARFVEPIWVWQKNDVVEFTPFKQNNIEELW